MREGTRGSLSCKYGYLPSGVTFLDEEAKGSAAALRRMDELAREKKKSLRLHR